MLRTQNTQNEARNWKGERLALAAGGHGLAVGPLALESGADLVGRLVGRPREVSACMHNCTLLVVSIETATFGVLEVPKKGKWGNPALKASFPWF